MADPEMSWSHTSGGKLIKLKHEWTIENFSYLKGVELNSSTFSASEHKDEKWCLDVYPMGESEADKGYVSIFLSRKSKRDHELITKVKFMFLNSQNKVILKRSDPTPEGTDTFSAQNRSWGFGKAIARTDLLNKIAADDKLIVLCEVSYPATESTTKVKRFNDQPASKFEIPKCAFRENLKVLLEAENLSDVILEVGDFQLKAHKAMLAAQSPVFAAMFQHEELEESKNNMVKIEEFEPEVVQEMLRFMYTGESLNFPTMAESLLAAADKYGLERLKVICEESLFTNLTVERAAKTLYLADLHSAKQLKRHVIEYICANPSTIETEEWKELNKSLTDEVVKAIFKGAKL